METENSMPFLPEELVEQDGPNMGNISDVDLAWDAALLEDRIRLNMLRIRDPIERQDMINEKIDTEMGDITKRRTVDALKHLDTNISEGAKRVIISDASSNFIKEHKKKTKERIKKEVEATKTEERSKREAKRAKEEKEKRDEFKKKLWGEKA